MSSAASNASSGALDAAAAASDASDASGGSCSVPSCESPGGDRHAPCCCAPPVPIDIGIRGSVTLRAAAAARTVMPPTAIARTRAPTSSAPGLAAASAVSGAKAAGASRVSRPPPLAPRQIRAATAVIDRRADAAGAAKLPRTSDSAAARPAATSAATAARMPTGAVGRCRRGTRLRAAERRRSPLRLIPKTPSMRAARIVPVIPCAQPNVTFIASRPVAAQTLSRTSSPYAAPPSSNAMLKWHAPLRHAKLDASSAFADCAAQSSARAQRTRDDVLDALGSNPGALGPQCRQLEHGTMSRSDAVSSTAEYVLRGAPDAAHDEPRHNRATATSPLSKSSTSSAAVARRRKKRCISGGSRVPR